MDKLGKYRKLTTNYNIKLTVKNRSLRKIDTTAFSVDILQSGLYGELELDADSYADLFEVEVK